MVTRILIILLVVWLTSCQSCEQYINDIAITYVMNKTKATQQLAPYMLLSGKNIDDLGFSDKCILMDYSTYTTVQFIQPMDNYNITVYYGLCFNDACTAKDFNQNKGAAVAIINNYTSVKIPANSEVEFIQPRLNMEVKPIAIVMLVAFSIILILNLMYSLKRWHKMCMQPYQPVEEAGATDTRYTFEDSEPYNDDESTVIKKLSFEHKFQTYLCDKSESSDKIISFSVFKLFCVPLVIYGQEFYFRNFAANNYYAFSDEIYTTFYSKVAMFAVYLPDILFFISGYLLARKCLQLEILEGHHFAQFLGRKLYRLYPFYIATILIFSTISPSMHSGPVWYVYQNQVGDCSSYWWRSLLLIGNWWSTQCYAGGWFVQAEVQLTLVCLIFFTIHSRFRKIGLGIYGALLVTMIVITFVFTPKMPASLQNTISKKFYSSFTSTYNYLLFYLFGIGMALLKSNQSLNQKMVAYFEKNNKIELILTVSSICLNILILLRPSLWSSASDVEFTLCRIGVFISFLVLFLGGIFKPEDHENTSKVHQLAHYTYQIILFSPIITLSSVWGVSSFSYVSAINQLNLLITELILAVVIGLCLAIMIEYRFSKK